MRDLPLLNETRCTACGDCVQICPADCLETTEGLPMLSRPGDCVSCAACTLVCPVDALQMVEMEPA